MLALSAALFLLACQEEAQPNPMPAAGTGGVGLGQAGTGAGVGGGVAGTGVAGTGVAGAAGIGAAGTGAAGAAGMGTAGMAGPGPDMSPTFSAIFAEILTKGSTGNCMFGACHGSAPDPTTNGNLRITYDDKQGAYDNLVNVVSTSPLCQGRTLVIPGDPDNSLLMQKLGPTPPCGMRMPIGNPLTDAHMMQIATWIRNGAMND